MSYQLPTLSACCVTLRAWIIYMCLFREMQMHKIKVVVDYEKKNLVFNFKDSFRNFCVNDLWQTQYIPPKPAHISPVHTLEDSGPTRTQYWR